MKQMNLTQSNPIIWSDFPDPDVIRVENTYYMVSTTMHFMPGCVILRSYDLVHWEIATHVYEYLEDNEAHRLENNAAIYGKGMWAASFRFHLGTFYIVFVANDTGKTYLFQSEAIEGPWRKSEIEGFYHDCSLLFDDDGRCYLVYGNREIYLMELKEDLSGPKANGIHQMIIKDTDEAVLGYEGAHFYKIKGKYYVFLIHWLKPGITCRTEAVFVADEVAGEYKGREVLDDDMGYHKAGVAQGGIVDTPDGHWYAMLFQDHGAVGRIPVLVPVTWEGDWPVFGTEGKVPTTLQVKSTRPDYQYRPLVSSDDFVYIPHEKGSVQLKEVWEWNHKPSKQLWSVTERSGHLRIQTGKISGQLEETPNILTQRTMGPRCSCSVHLDGSELKEGDYMGITAFQGSYSLIAMTKNEKGYKLVRITKENKETGEVIGDCVKLETSKASVKVIFDFEEGRDEATFFYEEQGMWRQLGEKHKLYFRLDHFVGARVGLFVYATKETGGVGDFTKFDYK